MTALLTPPESTQPAPDELSRTGATQLSHVAANLLPVEVRAARKLRHLRRRLVFGLVSLVLLLVLGYGFVWQQTQAARDNLAAEQARTTELTGAMSSFGAVLDAQAETQDIKTRLAGAMASDLPWYSMIGTLQRKAPTGLRVTALDGEVIVADPNAAAVPATPGVPAPTSDTAGTVILSGTTSDYSLVADYVDALTTVPGVTAVEPENIGGGTATTGRLDFTLSLSLTRAVLGGRFTPPTGTTPAATTATTPSTTAGGN